MIYTTLSADFVGTMFMQATVVGKVMLILVQVRPVSSEMDSVVPPAYQILVCCGFISTSEHFTVTGLLHVLPPSMVRHIPVVVAAKRILGLSGSLRNLNICRA